MAESDPDRTFDADPDPGKNDMEQDVDHAARKKNCIIRRSFFD